MNKMIFLIPALAVLFSCQKETVLETNLLPGTWKLMKTELYENNTLSASAVSEELSTTYYFGDCISGDAKHCEMYIEEDGEQAIYSYVYNESTKTIILNQSTVFMVDDMNANELKLSRTYDNFRSTYEFLKEN